MPDIGAKLAGGSATGGAAGPGGACCLAVLELPRWDSSSARGEPFAGPRDCGLLLDALELLLMCDLASLTSDIASRTSDEAS